MNNQKTVLITGTSSGIGKITQERLSSLGYKVFGCARRHLDRENYMSVDLSDFKNCKKLFSKAKKYLGTIDILINNAGSYIYSPIEKMTIGQIKTMTQLNLMTPYYLSSLVIPDMKQNKWGRIINISSISASVGEGNASLYSATKAGLLGLTKALSLEVAQDNITVNSINPGWVKTELSDKFLNEEEEKDTLDVIPQKRFIEPVEIANLIVYLISEEAKGLTGQGINLCAGLSVG